MDFFRFWIIYLIILLVLLLIGVPVVVIIIRRRGSRRKLTDENKNISVTAASVSMGSSPADEMPEACDLFNSSAALKSPDNEDLVNHENNTSKHNKKLRSLEEIQENVENRLNQHTREAGASKTQTVTVQEEGLLYTELDFTQYRPETQRPLPQQEETNYAAIEFKLRQ